MARRLDSDMLKGQSEANALLTESRAANIGPLAMGIWVGSTPPDNPITYAEWSAGTPGYWAWIVIP